MMPSSSTISSLPTPSFASSSSSTSSTSSSPCAACKFLRRKCLPDCVFAPYFPPDNPQKFVHVHRVFGASNVTKLLNDLPTCHREDAVNSLAYEADMRLKDPIYGCVGVISVLQHRLRQLENDLYKARAELSRYQNHPAVAPFLIGTAAAAAAVGSGGGALTTPHAIMSVSTHGGGGGGGSLDTSSYLNMGGVGRENAAAAATAAASSPLGNPYYLQGHPHHPHHQLMVTNNYDGEMGSAARLGTNGGGYDGEMVATINGAVAAAAATSNIGLQLGGGLFLKNGGDKRPSTGQS